MVGMLCGLVVLVTACGSESAVPETMVGTDAPASTTAAATTSTTAAAEPDVVPVEVSPCSLVNEGEVATAAGLTVVEFEDATPISCVFDFGEETGVAIFVNVDDGEGRFGAPASLFDDYMAMVADGSAEIVSDLGVAAVYVQGFRGLAVDAGDGRFIGLGVNGGYGELSEPRDVLIEIAGRALGRL
jgi:hypothetical protein